MKIDNSPKSIGPEQGAAGSRTIGVRPGATGSVAGASSAGQAATVVSTSFPTAGGSEGTFDSQKVAEIRQAISEGKFQINPERIADGLIISVREMLDRDRRPRQD